MHSNTHRQVMLITGSNTGIGNATAKLAAAAGYITYGGVRRTNTFVAVEAVGALPIHLDVTDEASMVAAVQEIEAKHGAIDILVNNAGYGQMGPIEAVTPEQWQQQYQTNVFGLVRMAQLVIPAMRRKQRGRILNVSSMGGEFTFPLAGAYHSTKYAVESITDALRFEVAPFGIEVICIQPGPVATPLAQTAIQTLNVSADSPYQPIMAAFHRMSQQNMGAHPPEAVAKVILRAIQTRRPRPRYKIGGMAFTLPLLRRLLPDRQWDRMIGRFYA